MNTYTLTTEQWNLMCPSLRAIFHFLERFSEDSKSKTLHLVHRALDSKTNDPRVIHRRITASVAFIDSCGSPELTNDVRKTLLSSAGVGVVCATAAFRLLQSAKKSKAKIKKAVASILVLLKKLLDFS
jgi:hypothetical protein